MSLFEWFGERYNPGPVGSLETHGNRRTRNRGAALCTGILALGVLATPFILVVRGAGWQPKPLGVCLAITLAYVTIGYYLRPKPDTTNMGWGGGLIDHPFRYSDDVNRTLMLFKVLLLPGRLLGIGVVDLFTALTTRRPSAD